MKQRVNVGAWMLTPVVVCASAFLTGWLGASVGDRLRWLVVGGLVGGLVGLVGWSLLILCLRKRQLGKTADATSKGQ
jgi:hypothetical protein